MNASAKARHTQIGIDRLVHLRWLERTAYLQLAGNDAVTIKHLLRQELQDSFRSTQIAVRGSLDKTLTILLRIWVHPPRGLEAFQQDGLRLLAALPREHHLPIHWGMTMAVYPFWNAAATHVGRLLRLQTTITAQQVQRRLAEQYGDRETVARRVRYVVRSFVDWGVLCETAERGVYSAAPSRPVPQLEVVAWVVEGLLHAQPNGAVEITGALTAPSLFPFQLPLVTAERLAAISNRLEVLPHGLDQAMILLRSPS